MTSIASVSIRPLTCILCLRGLQVDLGFLRFVTAIGTQGAISKETKKQYYVRSYKVDLSSNGEDWVTVKEGNKQKVATIGSVVKYTLPVLGVVVLVLLLLQQQW